MNEKVTLLISIVIVAMIIGVNFFKEASLLRRFFN